MLEQVINFDGMRVAVFHLNVQNGTILESCDLLIAEEGSKS
jgi:hypothetical protein